jgi:hypothetical protein
MTAKTWLITIAILATLARLAVVWYDEPAPQEAYYFLCAERPAPAYFDGPGGTATVARWMGEYWRLASPLWALAATLACFALIRRLGDDKLAAWTALGLNLLPLFNVAAVQAGPMLPALTLLLMAALAFWRAFDAEKEGSLPWYLAGGACLAAGAWFSYALVPFALSFVLFVLCSPRHRRAVDCIGLILMLLIVIAALAPALEWNKRQDWIPMAGGTLRTLWQWNGAGFLRSMGESFLALSPLVAIGLPLLWLFTVRGVFQRVKPRFVALVALPGVVLWFYFALRGIDSAFLLFLAAPVLIFQALHLAANSRVARLASLAALIVAALFSANAIIGATQSGEPWKYTSEKVREAFLARSAAGGEGLFLIASNENLASVLGYHLRDDLIPPVGHPAVYVRESQDISSQFGLWPSYDDFVESETEAPSDEYFTEQKGENPFMGRSALYVSEERPEDLPQTIKAAFAGVTPLEKLPPRPGLPRPLYIYLCESYQTLPL